MNTDSQIESVATSLDNVETALYETQNELQLFVENKDTYTNPDDLVAAFRRLVDKNQELFATIKPTDDHLKLLGIALDPALKQLKQEMEKTND